MRELPNGPNAARRDAIRACKRQEKADLQHPIKVSKSSNRDPSSRATRIRPSSAREHKYHLRHVQVLLPSIGTDASGVQKVDFSHASFWKDDSADIDHYGHCSGLVPRPRNQSRLQRRIAAVVAIFAGAALGRHLFALRSLIFETVLCFRDSPVGSA